jgi:probable rRNA maturation factor
MSHRVTGSLELEVPFTIERLEQTASVVLDRELAEPAEMSFVIVDDERISELNRDWRGYDEPTDVLAFGLSELSKPAVDDELSVPFPREPDGALQLGEVVISLPTAERQALEHARALDEELRHLLIHGTLHLLGYDHAEPGEEAVMRAKEVELLAATAE